MAPEIGNVRRIKPKTAVDPSRQAAYDALRLTEESDAYLNLTLATVLRDRELSGRDAAFATELAHGTARMAGTYDAIIDAVVDRGVASLRPEVLVAIRLGAHQLLSMRVPSHAAVGTTVELVREAAGEAPVRLTNAVLRKVASRTYDDWLDQLAPSPDDDLVGSLAIRYAHPRWIVDAFLAALADPERVARVLAADNVAPTVTLVVRPGLATVDDLVNEGAEATRWSPYGAVLEAGDPGQLRAVRTGAAGVQDEGSQLAAIAFANLSVDGRDERWLDLCAGPGGKTALLTGIANARGAVVLATDRHYHRARLVVANVAPYRLPARVFAADATAPAWAPGSFDRVLLDAPCTGLGALRRRPDARWRRTGQDLADLVVLQRALLDEAVEAVRPGGVVAYITCSPHLAETREIVDALLAARADVEEVDVQPELPGVPDLGVCRSAQLWPDTHGTDAMFIALLRRLPN